MHMLLLRRWALMHPIDNIKFQYSSPRGFHINATNPTSGTAWHFSHFYAAGCKPACTRTKPPRVTVTCPPAHQRRRFNCTTPPGSVASVLGHNTTSYYAQRLDGSGFAAVVTLGDLVVSRVTYTWRQTSAGLAITQDVVFGLEQPWAAALNVDGLRRMLGKASGGDVQLGVAALVLHEMEIVGWYPQWLPAVYRAARTARADHSPVGV